jgi:hypothetical protein
MDSCESLLSNEKASSFELSENRQENDISETKNDLIGIFVQIIAMLFISGVGFFIKLSYIGNPELTGSDVILVRSI